MATQWTAGLSDGTPLPAATLNTIGATSQTYVPTWTANGGTPSVGNGILEGFYWRINKIVLFRMRLVWGSTTSAVGTSEWRFTLPFTVSPSASFQAFGAATVLDSGSALYRGVATLITTSMFGVWATDGGVSLGLTNPMAWTTNDALNVEGTFEVA